jgi:type II secretion system protein C
MKSILKIPRILLLANIILLVILGYIVVDFVFGGNRGQSSVLEPVLITIEEKKSVESEEPMSTGDPDIIIERNIFGSPEEEPVEQNPEQEIKEDPIPVVKAQLRLIATVAGDKDVACAVIENVKTKVQDLYRTGDEIEGTKIERIDRNKIILLYGGEREILNLYVASRTSEGTKTVTEPAIAQRPDASDFVNIISPTEREINKRAFFAKVGGMEAIIKKVKIAPYIEGGKEKGVRITGLEDLSMARYVGFENGDIIQNINGSTVTNRRKAFQILRKARSQSSIDIKLLRNQQEKKLSFGIK